MSEIYIPKTLEEYAEMHRILQAIKDKSLSHWEEIMRYLGTHDLFFFLNFISSDRHKIHSSTANTDDPRPLFFHQFYLDMCKQNQWAIDNLVSTFDGSARRGGKSTVRTKLASIQMALRWPDIAICIFSVEKQYAKRHFRVIKEELENNKLIKVLWSDLLFDDPVTAAKNGETVWSLEDGLRFKRSGVRSNQTIEHNAFMGRGPTGSGYDVIHFDDCENNAAVANQDQISLLHESFSSAIDLATPSVLRKPIIFVTNTFYHPEGIAKKKYDEYKKEDPRRVRAVPGEDRSRNGNCPFGGVPVYPFTEEILWQKYNEMDDKDDYGIQYCCDFTAGQDRSFKRDWIQWYDEDPEKIMKGKLSYVNIDASKGLYDPMAISVWSVGVDKKIYWTGGLRRKLDPASPMFHDEIFALCAKVSNLSQRLVEIRVEEIAQQTWASLIRSELQKRGMHTNVIPCKGKLNKSIGRKFNTTKLEREWQRLSPPLQRGEIVFPVKGLWTYDDKGKPFNLVEYFLNFEYDLFPRAPHDDVLDAMVLLWEPDLTIQFPTPESLKRPRVPSFDRGVSWRSAS